MKGRTTSAHDRADGRDGPPVEGVEVVLLLQEEVAQDRHREKSETQGSKADDGRHECLDTTDPGKRGLDRDRCRVWYRQMTAPKTLAFSY